MEEFAEMVKENVNSSAFNQVGELFSMLIKAKKENEKELIEGVVESINILFMMWQRIGREDMMRILAIGPPDVHLSCIVLLLLLSILVKKMFTFEHQKSRTHLMSTALGISPCS